MMSQPSTTTQINKTELPAWVDAAGQKNYAEAERIAALPSNFYGGERVAGESADIGKVRSIFDQLGGIGPATTANSDVVAGQLADTDLSRYMNPYLENVEKGALDSLDRSRQLSLMGNSDAAAKAGSFGGSRHGIVDAVTNAEAARESGLLSAGLRSDAFNTALTSATGDINRRLQTDIYNRDTEIGNLKSSAEGLLKTGIMDQANRQAQIDSDMKKHDEPRQREIENLNLLLTSLGMSPYGQSSTSTQTHQGGSSGTDFGSLGLGVLSLLFGLSDDDSKEDKQKIGETDSGLGIWAFRYKGDPKDYPKSIGLMASEVEKVSPEDVQTLGSGTRVVNYAGLEAKGLLEGALS